MHTPSDPTPRPTPPGSTGPFPVPPPPPSLADILGSSLVKLDAAADDAPTVIRKHPADTGRSPDVAGQTLGHFELMETLGTGGMATVLKARDLQLGRIVALKILPPDTAKDAEVVTRFKQEARAAAKLDHDNVARVYFCGEDRGLHFIAFEFVEGETLRQQFDRTGNLSAGDAVRYMLQLSAGLQHAADRGVVHRDVKPSNILIAPDGKAKLVDMGLARHLESASVNGGVTQSGVTLGTFDYISPEQALDPRRADVRSDIYSLGCTFYHALTGRAPVPDGTAAKKLHAHQHISPLDPRDINPQVPDSLAAVLARMMAKDPDKRYQTPSALAVDLSALAREWNLPTDGSTTGTAVTPALPPAEPRLPFGLLLGGSAVVVAVAVLLGSTGGPVGPAVAPWERDKPVVKVTPPPDNTPTPAATPQVIPKSAAVADGKALAAALRAGEARIQLSPNAVYDLGAEPVAVAADTFTLEPEPGPGDPPTIRLTVNGRDPAVTIKAKRITLRGVRVVVRDGSDEAAEGDAVGLLFDSAEQVELDRVRVLKADAGGRVVGLAMTPAATGGRFDLKHAVFDLGPRAVGVRLTGKVTADLKHVAFAPHDAAVFLQSDTTDPMTVGLRECTFLLDRGSAAIEADGATATVTAGYCVFAANGPAPPGAGMPGAAMTADRPTVLRLAADSVVGTAARFTGRSGEPNAYYRTDAVATTSRGYTFDAARELSPNPAADGNAVIRPDPPWESPDPVHRLGGSSPELAFRLSLSDRKLFTDGPAYLLGAKELRPDGGRFYPADQAWPPPKPMPVVARGGQRVVWPDADAADAAGRIYPDLSAAFAALEPGDTLLIAANGPVSVKAPQEVPGLKATIKAYPNFTPELVPAPGFRDAAMFWLADGELTFDGLSMSLTGRQFVVRVTGGREVAFRNCVLTLDEKDDPQAVVGLFDPPKEMRTGPTEVPTPPAIRFDRTLVRGKGRAVAVAAARPFELSATNTAFALDGSLLTIDPAAKDGAMTTAEVVVRLDRVTTLLTGPVIELRGPRDGGGRVVPVAVTTDRCLFAPASPGLPRPLVLIDDADPSADVRRYLTWTASRPSVYANYSPTTPALELRATAGDGVTFDLTRWQTFARDDGKGVPVSFSGKKLRTKLGQVKASDLHAQRLDGESAAEIDAGATLPE